MDEYIKKIYDMMYSPIVTPYNLLENAKLDNYSYVKYHKNSEGLIAEMECVMPYEGIAVFFYYFDKEDYLQEIYMEQDGTRKLVFNRLDATNEAKAEYMNAKPVYNKAV